MDGKKKVPEVRFRGFSGEWEEQELHQIVDVRSGRDYKHLSSGNIPVYGTGGYMLSVNEALSYKEDAVGIGRKGTIDKPYLLKAPFWTVDTLFYAVPKINYHLDFIYDIFQKINWNQKNEATGVPSLSKVAINGISIYSTTHPEQSRIGIFFQHLDHLITLHQKKHNKLTNIKKAMLEKMFPKNGADVPEIRFKGFEGAWEKKNFGECVLIQRGGSPRPIENFITDNENGINWIKIGDVSNTSRYITKTKEKIIQAGEKHSRRVYKGDLILSNSMSFGRPYIMAIEGCIHDGWLLIRDEEKIFHLEYLLQLLSSDYMLRQYRALASGGVVINLNSELVQSTKVYVPIKTEQQKIGTYFQNLDQLITLQQTQLAKLKNIKKACLEKMFV